MNLGFPYRSFETPEPKYLTSPFHTPQKIITLPPSPMPSKQKMRNKKRRLESLAPLYTEDIGNEGIKPSLMNTVTHPSISPLPLGTDEEHRRGARMKRFGIQLLTSTQLRNGGEPDGLSSALLVPRKKGKVKMTFGKPDQTPLVGTSTALEKDYFRLTTYPKKEDVRPLPVLIKSLAHIKSHFIKTEDFDWANEQLKSVRQDITVQHIRNKFVLEVYETHARILLEHGDLDEFNQCQTVIHSLSSPLHKLEHDGCTGDDVHALNVPGEECLRQSEGPADEFYAYGILYNLVQNSWGEMTRLLSSSVDKSDTSSVASSEDSIPPCLRGSSVRHALKVVKAVMHNDYQAFFRLYESAPHMSAYLMDFLVRRVRSSAYERIVSAYRPTLSIEHFREALFFQDLEETRRFLKKNGAVFVQEQGGAPFWVDCKASQLSNSKN